MDVYQLVYNQGRYGDDYTEKHKLTQEEFDTLILAVGSNSVQGSSDFAIDVQYELKKQGFDTYSFADVALNPCLIIKLHNAIQRGKIFVDSHEEGVFAFCRKDQIKEAARKMVALERKIVGPDEFDF